MLMLFQQEGQSSKGEKEVAGEEITKLVVGGGGQRRAWVAPDREVIVGEVEQSSDTIYLTFGKDHSALQEKEIVLQKE